MMLFVLKFSSCKAVEVPSLAWVSYHCRMWPCIACTRVFQLSGVVFCCRVSHVQSHHWSLFCVSFFFICVPELCLSLSFGDMLINCYSWLVVVCDLVCCSCTVVGISCALMSVVAWVALKTSFALRNFSVVNCWTHAINILCGMP